MSRTIVGRIFSEIFSIGCTPFGKYYTIINVRFSGESLICSLWYLIRKENGCIIETCLHFIYIYIELYTNAFKYSCFALQMSNQVQFPVNF